MPQETDYSQSYNELRQRLEAETEGVYRAFLKDLRPDYMRVQLDIGLGYLALIAVLFVVSLFRHSLLLIAVLPAGALLVGYFVAYLHLFLHEAAHYNLSPDRRRNDLLCDVFISWLIGTSIHDYRIVHMPHHRKLGAHDDTERSYFNALTWRFLLETLAGIHAIRVYLFQMKVRRDKKTEGEAPPPSKSRIPFLRALLAHVVLAGGLVAVGAWPSALAWVLGVGVFFPLFATVRQMLEHRAADADPSVDYTSVPHGALARIFGDDIFSRTFGGAGFNRHLLHHWEPQISYTRLADFEKFLLTSSAEPLIRLRRSSYWKTFRELMKNDSRSA